jgi:hypothetical protein
MATLDRVALAGEVGMVGNQLNRFEQAGKVGRGLLAGFAF